MRSPVSFLSLVRSGGLMPANSTCANASMPLRCVKLMSMTGRYAARQNVVTSHLTSRFIAGGMTTMPEIEPPASRSAAFSRFLSSSSSWWTLSLSSGPTTWIEHLR